MAASIRRRLAAVLMGMTAALALATPAAARVEPSVPWGDPGLAALALLALVASALLAAGVSRPHSRH